jgi:hypothetical protein
VKETGWPWIGTVGEKESATLKSLTVSWAMRLMLFWAVAGADSQERAVAQSSRVLRILPDFAGGVLGMGCDVIVSFPHRAAGPSLKS